MKEGIFEFINQEAGKTKLQATLDVIHMMEDIFLR